MWRKTRDIVVETLTMVRAFDKRFTVHMEDEDKKFEGLFEGQKHCPESGHIKDQNGMLLRHSENQANSHKEILAVKAAVTEMKNTKVARSQLIADGIKFILLVSVIGGFCFGLFRYMNTKEAKEESKIEAMFERLMNGKLTDNGNSGHKRNGYPEYKKNGSHF